jgi:hypothetical protein
MSLLATASYAEDLWDENTQAQPVRSVFDDVDSVYLPAVEIPDPDELRTTADSLVPGESALVFRLDELVAPDPNAYRDYQPGGFHVETRLTRYEIRIRRRVNGVLSILARTSEHRLGTTGRRRFQPLLSTPGTETQQEPAPKRFSTWTNKDTQVLTLGVDGCWLLAGLIKRRRTHTPAWAQANTTRRRSPQPRNRWRTRRVYAETRDHLHIGLSEVMNRVAEAVLGAPASLSQRYPLLQGYIDRCYADDTGDTSDPRRSLSLLREADQRAQRLVRAVDATPPRVLAALRDATAPADVATRLLGRHVTPDLIGAVAHAGLQGLQRAVIFVGLLDEKHMRDVLTIHANGDCPQRIITAAQSRRVLRLLDPASREALAWDMIAGSGWLRALHASAPAPTPAQWKALKSGEISLGPAKDWAELHHRLLTLRVDLGRGVTGRPIRPPAVLRQIEGRTGSGLRLRLARHTGDSWRWAAELGFSPTAARATEWASGPQTATCSVRDERGHLLAVAVLTQPSRPAARAGDVDGYLIGAAGQSLDGTALAWDIEDHLIKIAQRAAREGRPGWTTAWPTNP